MATSALWFDGDVASPQWLDSGLRWGSSTSGLWALEVFRPIHASLHDEAQEVISHYGGFVEGVSYLLVSAGFSLPETLKKWGVARDVPTAEIGTGQPTLLSVNGEGQLALTWRFGEVRAAVTTCAGLHLVALTPSTTPLVALSRQELDVPRHIEVLA